MLFKKSCTVLIITSFLILSRSITNAEFNETMTPRSNAFHRNCVEATASNFKSNGIYAILDPNYSEHPFNVTCESNAYGSGWTIILRRTDGSVDFYRDWNTYKKGFGELDGEFFLGLDKIHAMTSERSQQLLVDLEDFEQTKRFELYERFAIDNEEYKFALHTLGKAYGSAGDSLRIHHGMKFSTFDRHYANYSSNCAEKYHGAWWYNACQERYEQMIMVLFKFFI